MRTRPQFIVLAVSTQKERFSRQGAKLAKILQSVIGVARVSPGG